MVLWIFNLIMGAFSISPLFGITNLLCFFETGSLSAAWPESYQPPWVCLTSGILGSPAFTKELRFLNFLCTAFSYTTPLHGFMLVCSDERKSNLPEHPHFRASSRIFLQSGIWVKKMNLRNMNWRGQRLQQGLFRGSSVE